ncbi:hypothetical protein, partial [Escherichia coli]|uniref:hypothetical protein n=1 Tax=Escherichia coli TaxID=562 RepID=UPI001BDB8E10
AVRPLAEWQALFELSDRHGFVIASDECYSEIYFRDEAPLGLPGEQTYTSWVRAQVGTSTWDQSTAKLRAGSALAKKTS